ncbi:MAG TPA: 2-hydroxyacid dehydrogenase [Acidimicrobiales bacterium]
MSSRLVVSVPDAYLADALATLDVPVEILDWQLDGPSPRPSIDIVVPRYMKPQAQFEYLRGVSTRLVQFQSIGYDGIADLLPPGTVFANATSVHETSTAELAVALILAAQRGLADYVRAAARGRWEPDVRESLADRSVLLVGYGGVGRAIDRRLAPFEVDIVRVARHARREGDLEVHAWDDLAALLPHADVVVLSLPLNDSTYHLVDAAFLARLRDGALLVNVGRGPVVVTDALVSAATSGRLRAALDVVEPEPLPDGHPLFALPNVLIAPHVGGATSAMRPRMARLLVTQVERMQRGNEPINVVLRT